MPPRFRLLADDLSGALDSAVAFVDQGSVGDLSVSTTLPAGDSMACNLGTRDLQEGHAKRCFNSTIPWLLEAKHPFVKIDSRLRGHVAGVLRIAADHHPRIVVTPAAPSHGRIAMNGLAHTVDDTGNIQTEPVNLVSELESRGASLARRESSKSPVDPITWYDATTENDLDRIVATVQTAGRQAILCGSSGLATALARSKGLSPPRINRVPGPLLMVVGTGHPTSTNQLMAFNAALPGHHFVSSSWSRLPGIRPLVVTAPIPDGADSAVADRCVNSMLARIATEQPPGTVFVTGGATLETLCRHLDARSICLTGLFAPGVPVGRFADGRWKDSALIAKSGGFGETRLFLAIADAAAGM